MENILFKWDVNTVFMGSISKLEAMTDTNTHLDFRKKKKILLSLTPYVTQHLKSYIL
jgi:hypothetical protein